MAIQFGSTAINAIKYRNASGVLQDVTSVVRNGAGVWEKHSGWTGLKFTAIVSGSTVKLEYDEEWGTLTIDLLKSLDNGRTWSGYTNNDVITLSNDGDSVCFKAGVGGNETFCEPDTGTGAKFVLSGLVAASGNIMSILDASMARTSVSDSCFAFLFENCTALCSAPLLPATELATACYHSMFKGCSNLCISAGGGVGDVILNVPSGTAEPSVWSYNMFKNTGGTFRGTPSVGIPYYCYQ